MLGTANIRLAAMREQRKLDQLDKIQRELIASA